MIASTKKSPQTAYALNDERFLEMIPAIQQHYAQSAFRNLRSPSREEKPSAPVVADAFFAFRRLVGLGKQDRAYTRPPLARFSGADAIGPDDIAGATRGRDLARPREREPLTGLLSSG